MKKQEPLKARGIRFSDEQWDKIEREALKDKTKRTKPSDIVRHAIDKFFERRA